MSEPNPNFVNEAHFVGWAYVPVATTAKQFAVAPHWGSGPDDPEEPDEPTIVEAQR